MRAHILRCIIFCIISFNTVGADETQETVVVLLRNVSTEDSPIYPYWYHPKYEDGEFLEISIETTHLPSGTTSHHKLLPLNSTFGSSTIRDFELKATEDTNKYCVELKNTTDSILWRPQCESKVNWMTYRRYALEKFTIPQLVIPGTHQSAACLTDVSGLTLHEGRYMICQSRSIKKQLEDGIRYLDLRPGIEIVDGKPVYNLYNDWLYLMPMDKAVEEINEFMDMSEDIVIVSFKDFSKGFNTADDHYEFQKYLKKAFEKHANSYGKRTRYSWRWWTTTLKDIWASDKRLIVSYYDEVHTKSEFLWPQIAQLFANARTNDELESKLTIEYRNMRSWRYRHSPHAAMAEFTYKPPPTNFDEIAISNIVVTSVFGVSLEPKNNRRLWADHIAPYIFEWFTKQWNTHVNIIAVDFYQGSGIVDLAIQMNENRAKYFSNFTDDETN